MGRKLSHYQSSSNHLGTTITLHEPPSNPKKTNRSGSVYPIRSTDPERLHQKINQCISAEPQPFLKHEACLTQVMLQERIHILHHRWVVVIKGDAYGCEGFSSHLSLQFLRMNPEGFPILYSLFIYIYLPLVHTWCALSGVLAGGQGCTWSGALISK